MTHGQKITYEMGNAKVNAINATYSREVRKFKAVEFTEIEPEPIKPSRRERRKAKAIARGRKC